MSAKVLNINRSTAPAERKPLDVRNVPLRGLHLIEASAGTGKTYTITSLVLRLLLEEELPIESILAVTFTNAATAELKERVVARVEAARRVAAGTLDPKGDAILEHVAGLPNQAQVRRLLDRAAQDADRAGIFTIHGFAARMLRDHAFESGAREDTELVGDQRAIVQDVVTDFWTSRIATLPEKEFRCLGGTSFFRVLMKVGMQASGAFEVPLVELERPLELAAEEQRLSALYERARAEFFRQGQELRELLVSSPALNRVMMRVPSLESDFAAYLAYFASGDPSVGHPDTVRFTQSKVNDSTKGKFAAPQHDLLGLLEELRDAAANVKRAAIDLADHFRAELCRLVASAVHEEHERAGTQSFDGLLADLCQALRHPTSGVHLANEIRRLLPVALIDEFQDTDPLQYEIFERIYAQAARESQGDSSDNPELFERSLCALYLIGDPKQSIYAFRGADVFTYLKAARAASGGIWTLATSYRASPSLVRAQNALFSHSRDPFGVPGIVYDKVAARREGQDVLLDKSGDALPGISLLDAAEEDPFGWLEHCAREIARFLALGHQLHGKPVTPKDIAVLTRTNRQAQDLQASLRRLGIPAVMHGDRSVLESDEAMELRRVLVALAEPGHRTLCRTALASRMLGQKAHDLAALDRNIELLEEWTGKLRLWGQLWRERGVAHALESLASGVNLTARTLADRDGERRMTNFRHLLELLHEAETSEHLGVAGLLRWLEGAIADPSAHAMAAEARQLRLESDADSVTLTTAHKSKGLEYNIVFLPTVAQGDLRFTDEAFRFYHQEQGRSLFEMRGSETRGESQALHDREGHQESLRLGYVALTRAKHHVVVLCGAVKKFSAVAYWLHAPAAQVDVEDLVEHLKKLKPHQRQADLTEVAALSEGAINITPLSLAPAVYYERDWGEVELHAPPSLPILAERERTSSFSAMTRTSQRGLSRAAREGHDVDEVTSDEELLRLTRLPAPTLTRSLLADFPRGARPGDALHAMFEFSPFASGESEQRAKVVERELGKRGFGKAESLSAAAALEEILQATFVPAGATQSLSLAALGPQVRRAEMEFSLPVGSHDARLSSARLARALGFVEPSPNAPSDFRPPAELGEDSGFLTDRYVESVSRLGFSAWSGFLRGFIDLVYEWEGRLYVVDYKSNYLGEHYEQYTREALQEAMEEHHYILQALLYSVAIHRYGESRIVNYDFESHFGGVQYLFLRGMHSAATGSGIYDFRPSRSLIEKISNLLRSGQ